MNTASSINPARVRRSALNLIYAVVENGGSWEDFNLELFWPMALERDTDLYRDALAKAVLHTCRASADSARLLAERAQKAQDALHADLTTAAVREALERYANRTDEWEESLAALRAELNNKRADGTDELARCTRASVALARALQGLGAEILPLFADFPAYRSVLEPLGAVIRRRGRLMEACAGMADEEYLAGKQEFAGLLRRMRDLQELRPAAEQLASRVLEHRETLETEIAGLLEHYSTARLDTVDHCILLLALYELRVEKLSTPIVVSEANELADTYSGGKSAPFIHGVLAAAAKQ
ncbi:MAG: transcription antitermination factor NusB [Akkermansia sp.]|nr:transcription antitermination factor NusB [Akkermansia sp.]